jgi:hypothetical protein
VDFWGRFGVNDWIFDFGLRFRDGFGRTWVFLRALSAGFRSWVVNLWIRIFCEDFEEDFSSFGIPPVKFPKILIGNFTTECKKCLSIIIIGLLHKFIQVVLVLVYHVKHFAK